METSSIAPLDAVRRARAAEVYRLLGSQPAGLTSAEAAERLGRYGHNLIREIPGKPLIIRLLANFTHLMAMLLWVGGLVGFIARMPQLAMAIWMVNLINGAFSFWQEYKAEQATAALRRLLPAYAHVLRNGEQRRLPAEELVPGDVLLLSEGDHISADGRLVEEAELRIDQSALTGESRPVRKSAEAALHENLARVELPNIVFAGTSVTGGTGRAVVCATGMETAFGTIAHLTQSVTDELSPLQREMARVTRTVTVIAVAIGAIFFVISLLLTRMTAAESFIFAMGMIVAFVPEGLLPTVTLALALGTQRMARRNALVKRLSAVETLGCTTVICTDKTGTLTQNEMTVRELWLAGRCLSLGGVGYAPEGEVCEGGRVLNAADDGELRLLLAAAGLCCDARLLPPSAEVARWSILGDPTEAALLVAARKAGLDLEREASAAPRLRELPFDSRRKRMTTIHAAPAPDSALHTCTLCLRQKKVWEEVFQGGLALPETLPAAGAADGDSTGDLPETLPAAGAFVPHPPSPKLALVKGAPREVLALCTRLRTDGVSRPLDEQERAAVLAANDGYARAGLRVLAVAMRLLSEEQASAPAEEVECELTFLGLAAMMDPPRPEVAAAVEKCRRAAIRIIMITGDYGLTAESIARRIGIVSGPHPRIITGADLDTMDAAALAAALAEEVIFARVAPEHKLRVVTALREAGHVVAVTGDGVNDAPALKRADIGVAMGLAGTDVAKEAADIILTDDNFASIVNAVEEGRAVYANIKKFTTYIFTSNTPEAVPFIFFALSGGRIPIALNVMHVLAVDLGTDIVPALALGAEPPEPGLMERPPRRLSEHVINRAMLTRAYLWLGPVQSLATMAAFYLLYWTNGYWGQWVDLPAEGAIYGAATGMALAAVVTTQIGNLFTQRSEQTSLLHLGWPRNRLIWAGIAVELALVLLIIYTPPLQALIGTSAFVPAYWLFLFAWVPALPLADELRKWVRRHRFGKAHSPRNRSGIQPGQAPG